MRDIDNFTVQRDEIIIETLKPINFAYRKDGTFISDTGTVFITNKRIVINFIKGLFTNLIKTFEIDYSEIVAIRVDSELNSKLTLNSGTTLSLLGDEAIIFGVLRSNYYACLIYFQYIFSVKNDLLDFFSCWKENQYLFDAIPSIDDDGSVDVINETRKIINRIGSSDVRIGKYLRFTNDVINIISNSIYQETEPYDLVFLKIIISKLFIQAEIPQDFELNDEQLYQLQIIGINFQINTRPGLINSNDDPKVKSSSKDESKYYKSDKSTSEDSQDSKEINDDLNKALKELDNLIGLSSVKNEVRQLISLVQIQKERSQFGIQNTSINRHLVFQGPPGTGKTTIARIIGKIYKSLGILSKGHFIESDRSKFVAGYIGQTAIQTNAILNEALGGVLFIDEAYSLAEKYPGGSQGYGKEAIDTILKFMEDNRDDLVVIVAGYDQEMEEFLNSNPGLKSRFNTFIDFPNFDAKELFEIFMFLSNESGYFIEDETKRIVENIISRINEFKKPNFGNARSMRNLLEIVIKRQSLRLTSFKDTLSNNARSKEDLMRLIDQDFEIDNSELSKV
tara:strand:- start:309 stop:2003 length:1695 start_codon:yes stop_codon:yes gene_type:complete